MTKNDINVLYAELSKLLEGNVNIFINSFLIKPIPSINKAVFVLNSK